MTSLGYAAQRDESTRQARASKAERDWVMDAPNQAHSQVLTGHQSGWSVHHCTAETRRCHRPRETDLTQPSLNRSGNRSFSHSRYPAILQMLIASSLRVIN
jgi:hypothetical protein